MQVNVIKQYENTLTQLNGITDEALSAETEEGKKLRSTILYQDYINRGFAKERASREVKRIFDSEENALLDNKPYNPQNEPLVRCF